MEFRQIIIFNLILVINSWGISREVVFMWLSPVLTDDKSILDQVMAWCRQATSHYLSQCCQFQWGKLTLACSLANASAFWAGWVLRILNRTHKGHLFSYKCSRNLVSHTLSSMSPYGVTWPQWVNHVHYESHNNEQNKHLHMSHNRPMDLTNQHASLA